MVEVVCAEPPAQDSEENSIQRENTLGCFYAVGVWAALELARPLGQPSLILKKYMSVSFSFLEMGGWLWGEKAKIKKKKGKGGREKGE